ncbi:MAG: 7-carboxy-7-deazaguanine synthase QueE [Armatimonadetes bacterium]|nr:7-carboxy-7-deazaguanine synthase QueE [Armatimonadota bacterium]MDW8121886.1 7-carboxy-7-deazaguanine synthase QueE [Armatimonadota bacterium]
MNQRKRISSNEQTSGAPVAIQIGERLKVARGNISEIYLSLQGEALWVGLPMVFVRTSGCHRRCAYCDTEYALVKEPFARLWGRMKEGMPDAIEENPVTVKTVVNWIRKASQGWVDWVAFTGGEPLLQVDFLVSLTHLLRKERYRILLETEGGLADHLEKILPYLSAVAADIKLPSTTGESLDKDQCSLFFRKLAGAPVEKAAKIVVTQNIDESEWDWAVQMLADIDDSFPLILQPVTPARFVTERPKKALLMNLCGRARKHLKNVRIVPQVHKFLNIG